MKELTEIRFDSNTLILENNHVKSPIIPQTYKDLDNEIVIRGETIVEGAVFAQNLTIEHGPLDIKGAFMVQHVLLEKAANEGRIDFRKAVACTDTVSLFGDGQKYFHADLNAKKISLKKAVVAANVCGNEIELENCVVLGGIFATKTLKLVNCVIGTFNSPSVEMEGNIYVLFPSVFSVEPVSAKEGTTFTNLTLADWGALMRHAPESEKSGAIHFDLQNDCQTTTLTDAKGNSTLWQSYSVAAKVLATDLLDYQKLQNHFIFSVGTMGPQLFKNYTLDGNVPLTLETISNLFYDILTGKIVPRVLDGKFTLKDIKEHFEQ